jgi:hypothetical protein
MSDKSFGNGSYPEPRLDTRGNGEGLMQIASAKASRRQFIKGVIASGAAVSGPACCSAV